MAARWQYLTAAFYPRGFFTTRIDRPAMEQKLKELDEEGWELVSTMPIMGRYGTHEVLMIFKRPLS